MAIVLIILTLTIPKNNPTLILIIEFYRDYLSS